MIVNSWIIFSFELLQKVTINILGGGNGNPFQYSCLENLTDRGASQTTVYEKGQTPLSD